MQARRFAQTQGSVRLAALSLAAETRKAQVGNFNKLQWAREQSFYADVALNQAQAMQPKAAAREHLTRLLGLCGEQAAFKLPARLPDLPPTATDQPEIERSANEWTGVLAEPARSQAAGTVSMAPQAQPRAPTEVKVRKPAGGHAGH